METNEGFFVRVSLSSFLRVKPFPPSPPSPHVRNGFTFIELLVVSAILLILASAVMPLARTATRVTSASPIISAAAVDAVR